MTKRELRLIIRETKLLERRLIARNKKKVKVLFLDFTRKIAEDNGLTYADNKIVVKIDYEWLLKKTRNVLENIYLYNFDEVSSYFQNVYKKKLDRKVIAGIKDYFLNNWNKKHALKKAKFITQTTRKKLNAVIVEAQEKGLAHKSIVEQLINAAGNMSKQRADTIARTETSSSINTTNYHIAEQAKMKRKGWIHIGGKKMDRENHKKINGLFIGLKELFDLGNGIKAEHPHDSTLPASEVVRCSCLMVFE